MNLITHTEEKPLSSYSQPRSEEADESTVQADETAVQARVTAEEFAQALASLESRKAQAEHTLQNTVQIGDALQQLGITVSAEEVLREVQAHRERQAREQQAALLRRQLQRKRRRFGLGMVGGLLLSLVSLGAYQLAFVRPSAIVVAPPATAIVSPEPQPAVLQTLAEVPDGQLVQYDAADLPPLLRKPALSPSTVLVQPVRGSVSPVKWMLVKHNGHIYVRGYMAAMSPQAMKQMKTVQIYSGRYDSSIAGGLAYVKPVTLRIGSFTTQETSFEGPVPNITVSGLHLDEYANDRPDL